MRMIGIVLMLAFTLTSFVSDTEEQSIDFFEGTYEELLSKAKKTKKPIFLDFYADWCGPCKQMEKYSFTDPEFAKLINEDFIPFRVNVDYFWGMDVAEKYNIKNYPTVVFTDKKGNEKKRLTGFKSGDELEKVAKSLSTK